MTDWIDWHRLEGAIPLDELPSFHRAFLKLTKPDEADWDKAFLRQVQGKVQASLKALERQGFLEAGMDMVAKPFSIDLLANKIRTMISQKT